MGVVESHDCPEETKHIRENQIEASFEYQEQTILIPIFLKMP